MIIQLGHARHSDYQNELYIPIRESSLSTEYEWIFPHEGASIDSRESLKTVDLFIADVSHPATGLGIELGFASLYGKRILCISKKGSKIATSLKYITEDFLEYENQQDMISKIEEYISRNIGISQKKIYVGCALTHASPEFREEIRGFKDSLRSMCHVLDYTGVIDSGTITAEDIYQHDRGCVIDCDVFVAECSYPSTGLGYEIATAVEHHKKILLIAREDAVVTRMILGIPPEKAEFFRYQTIEQVRTYIQHHYL